MLFLLNAAVTTLMGLPREAAMWLASDPGYVTRAFRALDAPTGYILLAVITSRWRHPAARRVTGALLVAGALLAVAQFPFHVTVVRHEHFLRALPLYVGLAGCTYILARGAPWERWVALALLARALYWGSAGVIDVLRAGLGDEPAVYVNRVALVALAAVSVAAGARLLREPVVPVPTTLLILVLGPGAALLETVVALSLPPSDPFRYGSVVILNLVTLGLVRPILTLIGVGRETLFPVISRTLVAGGVASLSTLVAPQFTSGVDPLLENATIYGFGICMGLLALAAFEAAPPLRVRGAAPMRAGAPTPPYPGAAAAPAVMEAEEARPQWQVVLLALQGSCRDGASASPGEPHLTQKAVVQRTGIRASRVSTIVRDLNETAELRLDAHLPGWREGPAPGAPAELIRQHRGAVVELPGVWVYYRLTPLGERLAEATKAKNAAPRTEFRENSPTD